MSTLTKLIVVAVLLATTSNAMADMITAYTSRTAFNTATGDPTPTVETFGTTPYQEIRPRSISSVTTNDTQQGSNISFSFLAPGVTYETTPGASAFDFNIDTDTILNGIGVAGEDNRVLKIDFDAPQQAVGFDTNYLMGLNFDITISFSSGPDFTQSNIDAPDTLTTYEFFGWISDSADIVSMTVDGNGNIQDGLGTVSTVFAVDNFTFSPIPEPSSFLFVGLAFCLSLFSRRCR